MMPPANDAPETGGPRGNSGLAPAEARAIGPATTVTSQQLDFLYKALDDNQSVIRFLDAKAAFGAALLSAMTGRIFFNLGQYFPWYGQPLGRQLLLICFAGGAALAVTLIGLIVFPSSNPATNTLLPAHVSPTFFLCDLDPKNWRRVFSRNPRFSRLAQEHGAYVDDVVAADGRRLVEVISAEVLKVSYIRQIKMDRLRVLAYVLLVCVLLFTALVIVDATLAKPTSLHEPAATPKAAARAAVPRRVRHPQQPLQKPVTNYGRPPVRDAFSPRACTRAIALDESRSRQLDERTPMPSAWPSGSPEAAVN